MKKNNQECLAIAMELLSQEITALQHLASKFPKDFSAVIDAILQLQREGNGGRLVTIGMGKSGFIARKIAASLASTGTPAFYVHPGEASHGDLGMITPRDIVLIFSNSGETPEVFELINYCRKFSILIIGVTMNPDSFLGQNSELLLELPKINEASSIGAPTSSAIMMLAMGDALTVALHETKNITKDDYLIFHPGGKIGMDLQKELNINKH